MLGRGRLMPALQLLIENPERTDAGDVAVRLLSVFSLSQLKFIVRQALRLVKRKDRKRAWRELITFRRAFSGDSKHTLTTGTFVRGGRVCMALH